MKELRLFAASLALTCVALFPAIAVADDELEVTMEVVDDISDVDGNLMDVRDMEDGKEGEVVDDFGGDEEREAERDKERDEEREEEERRAEEERLEVFGQDGFEDDHDFEDEDEKEFEEEGDFEDGEEVDDDIRDEYEDPMEDDEMDKEEDLVDED